MSANLPTPVPTSIKPKVVIQSTPTGSGLMDEIAEAYANAPRLSMFVGKNSQYKPTTITPDVVDKMMYKLSGPDSKEDTWKKYGYLNEDVGQDTELYELDDSKAKFKDDGVVSVFAHDDISLDKLLDHPDLFKAYPQLADVKVEGSYNTRGAEAFYDTGKKKITVNVQKGFTPNTLSTLLHEAQHGVQNVERDLGNDKFDFDSSLIDKDETYSTSSPHVAYLGDRDEIVARDVDNRRTLSEEQRRNILPTGLSQVGKNLATFNTPSMKRLAEIDQLLQNKKIRGKERKMLRKQAQEFYNKILENSQD